MAYGTLRGGVLPSKMCCPPPTASTVPTSAASADTTGLVSRYLWLWGTQQTSSDPYIPVLHFLECLGSALPNFVLAPSLGIAVGSSSTMPLIVFCLTEEL